MLALLPKVSPAQSPPLALQSSLSSMESCRRWVWRLEPWAVGSWAGCAVLRRLECPVGGGGAAAVNGAAGGLAGCAGKVQVRSQGLLQGLRGQQSPGLRAG